MTLDSQSKHLFQNIEKQSIGDFSQKAYLNYAMYVILDRALPHISDGLKPVQRRIIYAMSEIGLSATSKHKKSARTVGDVLGKYHPHGDSACYESMVLMAQNFSYRYPLIDGQGNWGTQDDPKSFAAMRYTESRLSPYASLLLNEIKYNTTEWVDNFDGTLKEPKLLPAQVPNVLLNGASGIAVGMSTDIPPHNIKEIIQSCLHLLDNPLVNLIELMTLLPAPDYPGGANIVSSYQDRFKIYKTGQGNITLQAVYEINSDHEIIITRLPYQVSSSKVIEQIAKLIKDKKMPWIKDIKDESDHDDPVRIILVLKSNQCDINSLISYLYHTTDLQKKYRVNMNMIGINGKPQIKPIIPILHEWLQYRKDVTIKRIQWKLDKITERLEILEGFLIAYLSIDKIIQIIRNEDSPKSILITRFLFNNSTG